MIDNILRKLFGDPSEKQVVEYSKMLAWVHAAEKKFENLSADDVKIKTAEFKALFDGLDFRMEQDSVKIKTILEDIKLEAFALVKQACKLLNGKSFDLSDGKKLDWNMIPYDVQLIGALSINGGAISEMKTGEWKTLVATLPAYLNALTGNTVHIVTVNDYLASRDAEEMGILYNMLGLTAGVITHMQSREDKQAAYACDVLYATNNELGFDYLRDNMVIALDQKVQSPLFFAIIDEVDSILIDEARTPLIISQPDNQPTSKYMKFATLAKQLENNTHYKIDEKQKTSTLTEAGVKKVEDMLSIENIYVSGNYNDLHHIENAIKSASVYEKDKDYLVRDDEVMIIDEHTGRVLSGRRYSDGLHQALEAKEWVEIKQESKTLASITFQNYFRMYWKLSGMTGTAQTEAEEFYKVYGLDTLIIPTNKPLLRDDKADLLFKNEKWKFDYVIRYIEELHKTGQPILVGTISVEKSEYLSTRLRQAGIKHNVLNAKHHETEAETIAEAGQKWAITIATNMAWRGTDIKLGNWVQDLWGLIILGTEKHETRRIDNQLRGRSGRQWDPGMTQYLISPNDDIMRIFGGDKLFSVFNSAIFASLPDDEPLAQSSMLTRKVTGVQKQVEWHNFDARKHVLEYDDVMNQHRAIIYSRRNRVLESQKVDVDIMEMIKDQISSFVSAEMTRVGEDDLNKTEMLTKINEFIGQDIINDIIEIDDVLWAKDTAKLSEYIYNIAATELDNLRQLASNEQDFYELEKRIMLSSIDELWMRHINNMSKLREEVAFEWYAQKQPILVYKEKAFGKFQDLLSELGYKVMKAMFSVQKLSQVEQVHIKTADLEMNSPEQALSTSPLNAPASREKQAQKNTNPLFAQPQGTPNGFRKPSKKIRV